MIYVIVDTPTIKIRKNMDHMFKLPIIGRCYTCGKPITEDELYAEITDGDDEICCEECWNEYLKRCENLLEQMKKEKIQKDMIEDKWSNTPQKVKIKKNGEIVSGFTDGHGHFDVFVDVHTFIRYELSEVILQ